MTFGFDSEFGFNSVEEAFQGLITQLFDDNLDTVTMPSRVGEVISLRQPVVIAYRNPLDCVLLNAARDCNPYFHLYEAAWMLAGSNLAPQVAHYNRRMIEFSDDGLTLNGAYGYRWRSFFGYDQLNMIIDELTRNPNSRRCYLGMWNAMEVDNWGEVPIDSDLYLGTSGESRDVPCNVGANFRIIDGALNMTVFNRSNDLVWGTFGANAVHFPYLLWYMADCIGVEVGTYYQVTDNLHVYTERWTPSAWIAEFVRNRRAPRRWEGGLVKDKEVFDEEITRFAKVFGDNLVLSGDFQDYSEPYIERVLKVMGISWKLYKSGYLDKAWDVAGLIEDHQWAVACQQWMMRRIKRREQKTNEASR